MFCYYKGIFSFKHQWYNTNIIWENIYLLFRRPMGLAKIKYCGRCGAMKFEGIKEV